ncbi:MAG: 30S ribosomal protein S5 [Candidatus Nanoarchaeia archaeon]
MRPRFQKANMTEAEIAAMREEKIAQQQAIDLEAWNPKTKVGKAVKEKKITNIDEALKYKILEPEIIDTLLSLRTDILNIGQAKGKFGGGKRRAWRQTQRKTSEGNVPTFACMSVVGNENGYVGLGYGRAKETLPARAKSVRKAKLGIIKIKRGCASFDCTCGEEHTVPFIVQGKAGSCRIKLMPAPQGTGLVIGNECKKILKLAGIKDVYSVTDGQKRSTINLAKACMDALEKTTKI